MHLNVSTLAVVMGLGLGLPQIYGLMKPAAFAAAVRKFPRSLPWGYALMLLGTLWFVWYVKQEDNSDFATYKPMMLIGFTVAGVAICIFVTDFLAVRGLAIVFMLLAKLMVDTVRWADTDWRWVISGWAYGLVVAGIWFTVSPWRLRDLLNWATANEKRIRMGSTIRLAFGLFVTILGLTVFR
jgi:hypothetical protein